jgi:DNA repair exonuclease SbcCD nuclease subunit
MKVALTADIHFCEQVGLSGLTAQGQTTRLEDRASVLLWVAAEAVRRGAERLLILGDVFDSRTDIPVGVLDTACRTMADVARQIPVTLLVGNHDAALRVPAVNSLQVFRGLADVVAEPTRVGNYTLLPWVDDAATLAGWARLLFSLARAAADAGIPFTLSTVSNYPLASMTAEEREALGLT